MSVLLSTGLFCACSNDGDEITVDPDGNVITDYNSDDVPSFEPSDVNHLRITRKGLGQIDSCWLYRPYCGIIEEPLYVSESHGNYHLEYPMVFTAVVKNSSLIDILQFDINSMVPKKIEDLRVGDTFVDIPYGPGDIYLKAWGGILYGEVPNAVNGVIPWEFCKGGTLGGKIQVVDKKTSDDGKTRITLMLQDLKFYDYDKTLNNRIDFVLNGLIEFEICEDGLYPREPQAPNIDELTIPTDGLVFFMMDALYKNKTQGRQTFFSEGSGKQECLIINSINELQEAYKGDWNTLLDIPFNYCTLVIVRTYGEYGGVTIDDFDLVDNGDSYQLNLTLNDYVNINYSYSPDYTDLYFWKLIPKIENKPVVFNRITQEAELDPSIYDAAYDKIRTRWYLNSYIDANGTLHQVNNDWGNERYFIEFKENGIVEGRIGENTFSCYYMLPYTPKIKPNYENDYREDLTYGVINLWDWNVTEANDNDPISKQFMRIFNATQFKLWSSDRLVLRLSENEVYGFMSENLKKAYGY